MASEAVKVIVRCRPINSRERDLKCKSVVSMDSGSLQCALKNPQDPNAPEKTFTFDGVYDQESTTEQIYSDIVFPLVEGILEGYNGTVFAYGQTGCGKSFSMQGVDNPSSQKGIIPRAFEHLFEAISASQDRKFLVFASYLEIYNEEIRDLLGKDIKKKLEMKEHVDKGVYIPDLTSHAVHNVRDCQMLMEKGWRNRAVGATLMNADSSRSHSIFTISIEMIDLLDNKLVDESQHHIRRGKLNLVDLAGSERQAKTGATGDRLKEATKINLSLSALGNVISALVDGKSKHIPYRDSKLTRLLQDSLGGNTKTLMIACVSPADNNYEETLSTLRYASRAKNIKNRPRINEDPKDALLRQYQIEIQKLKEMLQTNPAQASSSAAIVKNDESLLEEERRIIREEYEEKMRKLQLQVVHEKESNAKAVSQLEELKKTYEQQLQQITDQSKTVATTDSASDILKKLKEIEGNLVGGERADDGEIQERRRRLKRQSERKVALLAQLLSQKQDDEGILAQVCGDIQEEIRVKTELLKKYKQKVRSLEREIQDLQGEFETERVDYLESIRRQDQQLRLLHQILNKIQPIIRKDCNYSDLERIKHDSVWSDELQRWQIPDLVFTKTKLPPAQVYPGGLSSNQNSFFSVTSVVDSEEPMNDKLLQQKLERGEAENLAQNYFRPSRAKELLSQVYNDIHRASISSRKISSSSQNISPLSLSNSNLNSIPKIAASLSPNSVEQKGSNSTPLTTSWSAPNSFSHVPLNDWISGTAEQSRKPNRLESIGNTSQVTGDSTLSNHRKNIFQNGDLKITEFN